MQEVPKQAGVSIGSEVKKWEKSESDTREKQEESLGERGGGPRSKERDQAK